MSQGDQPFSGQPIPTAQVPPPVPAGGKKMSEIGRVIGVFFSPVKTFQDIARQSTWFVPLLIVIGLTLVSNVLVMPKMDIEGQIRERMEKASEKTGQHVDEASMEMQISVAKKIGSIAAYAGVIIGVPLVSLFIGLIYFGAIRVGGGVLSYMAAFSVVCFSGLPNGLKGLLVGLVSLGRERASLSQADIQSLIPSNPSYFLEKESVGAALYTILQFVDVFVIWSIALAIVGLSCVSNWSRGKCAALVIAVYAVFVLVVTGIAVAFG